MGERLVIVILCIVLTAFVLYHFRVRRRQEEELNRLIAYVQSINRMVYDLRIDENEEGALSRLSNEIYKTAVQLKEASERSREDNKKLARALADISHQIKTPMTAAQIALDNLLAHPQMDEAERMAFLRRMELQLGIVEQLIVSLLQMAKFDSGTIIMQREEVSARGFLEQVIEEMELLFDVYSVRAVLECAESATLFIDVKWEKEAYKNILKNAAEHSGEGASIAVSLEDLPMFICIRICDEGTGIPQREMPHLFERFYRGSGSADGNIGIGLNFARTVFEADGASVKVSSNPGRGTVFTIRYPKMTKKGGRILNNSTNI